MADAGHLTRALKAEFGVTAGEIRRSGRWERGGPRSVPIGDVMTTGEP